MIYLDNASTTSLCSEAKEAMKNVQENVFGNPFLIHVPGCDARKIISEARNIIAGSLNCKESEIIFTSGATESINTVLKGFWSAYPKAAKRLVTTSAEHSATLESCRYLERSGIEVIYLKPDRNALFADDQIISVLDQKPGLLSLMHVNNETGAMTDLRHISELIEKYSPRTKFHVDAAQSFRKFDIDVRKSKIDFMSASAHKIHGPKGTGMLFKRSGTILTPLIHGGNQENGFRSGTENTLAIAGFGAAVKKAYSADHREMIKIAEGFKQIFTGYLSGSKRPYHINSPSDASPYILNVSFPGIKPEVLLRILGNSGIFVSSTSACSSKSKRNSYVLKAMGYEDDIAGGAVRISFSRYNTVEEINTAALALVSAAEGIL